MTSDEVIRKQKQYLLPSVGTYYEKPLVLASGEGRYLYDLDGNRYLDFFVGILTVGVGHCHPKVTAAVQQQQATLVHTSTLYATERQVELAERLANLAPGDVSKSFFSNSGTEANETAIMLAQAATGLDEVIALRYGYSGRSQLALSLTGNGAYRRGLGGAGLGGVHHAPAPYCYRCPFHLTYPSCDLACARDVEELIQTTTGGRVAAFLAEPIMGVGGFITPPKEYFQVVVDIVRKYGGVYIADEVQTAWGRTGGKWWGVQQYGVQPDIMTSAKSLGNGQPIGWTAATPKVADAFTGPQIATFGGNPVSCAAALATLQVIEDEGLVENAALVGAHLRAGLEDLQKRFPEMGDVRGMGLMQAVELVADPRSKEPAPGLAVAVLEACRREGLLIGKGGLHGHVLRIAPALNIGRGDVDDALRMMGRALAAATGRS